METEANKHVRILDTIVNWVSDDISDNGADFDLLERAEHYAGHESQLDWSVEDWDYIKSLSNHEFSELVNDVTSNFEA